MRGEQSQEIYQGGNRNGQAVYDNFVAKRRDVRSSIVVYIDARHGHLELEVFYDCYMLCTFAVLGFSIPEAHFFASRQGRDTSIKHSERYLASVSNRVRRVPDRTQY